MVWEHYVFPVVCSVCGFTIFSCLIFFSLFWLCGLCSRVLSIFCLDRSVSISSHSLPPPIVFRCALCCLCFLLLFLLIILWLCKLPVLFMVVSYCYPSFSCNSGSSPCWCCRVVGHYDVILCFCIRVCGFGFVFWRRFVFLNTQFRHLLCCATVIGSCYSGFSILYVSNSFEGHSVKVSVMF